MIDHAFYATNIETQRNAQQLTGKLYDVDGNEMKLESPNQFGEAVSCLFLFFSFLFNLYCLSYMNT
jgi:hypothetical protein